MAVAADPSQFIADQKEFLVSSLNLAAIGNCQVAGLIDERADRRAAVGMQQARQRDVAHRLPN